MQESATVTSLADILGGSGATRLRLFDMGRRIVKIRLDDFFRFEKSQMPYPAPLNRQAWLALLLPQPKRGSEPSVWFLRFPLDEQARLNLAARDDFMYRLVEQIGADRITAQSGESLSSALHDNPYGFKPRDDRLAIFHARVSRLLHKPASRHYDHARAYFRGELGWEQWSFVGYQGIADIAARLDQNDNERILLAALPSLPLSPLQALCHCLENERISAQLSAVLLNLARAQLSQQAPSNLIISAVIRGISRSRASSLRRQLIGDVLESPIASDAEVLAAISGRAWESLTDSALAASFLENLANNSARQQFFDQCLADLLFIPGMREPLLRVMRATDRSTALARAVGCFFDSLGKA